MCKSSTNTLANPLPQLGCRDVADRLLVVAGESSERTWFPIFNNDGFCTETDDLHMQAGGGRVDSDGPHGGSGVSMLHMVDVRPLHCLC